MHEPNDLGRCRRIRSESRDDLGGHAALLSRGGAAAGRGRAVPELRGAGRRAARRARRPLPRIDIGWNTNLAFLQADAWSGHALPTDRHARHGYRLDDARSSPPPAVRSRRSPISAAARWRSAAATAAMPRSCRCISCEREGLAEGKDYRTLRFNSDVGKHGDTGTSEVEVLRAVLDGRADAGAIGSPFWQTRCSTERLVPEGALTRDLDVAAVQSLHVHGAARSRPGAGAAVRRGAVRDEFRQPGPPCRAGGRRACAAGCAPQLDGYHSLREAVAQQGFFRQPDAKPRCESAALARIARHAQLKIARQAALMRAFAIEGAAHRGKRFGERKNLAGDQAGRRPPPRPDASRRRRP